MKIIYYADNQSMGDTPADDCGTFRQWAEQELNNKYPDHDIIVSSEQSLLGCYTDDFDREGEIKDYCNRLWDNCLVGLSVRQAGRQAEQLITLRNDAGETLTNYFTDMGEAAKWCAQYPDYGIILELNNTGKCWNSEAWELALSAVEFEIN